MKRLLSAVVYIAIIGSIYAIGKHFNWTADQVFIAWFVSGIPTILMMKD